MSEFNKLPLAMIECEYCDYEFYYWSDYVAHKDVKHPVKNDRYRTNPQRRLFE